MGIGDIVQVKSEQQAHPSSHALGGKGGIITQLWRRQYALTWLVLFMDGSESWIDDYDLTTLAPPDIL